MGGLLASFGSLDEQKEAENYFVGKGFLLPQFHKLFWIGLRTPAYKGDGSKSKFTWLDGSTPAPTGNNYQRWGEPGRRLRRYVLQLAAVHMLPACLTNCRHATGIYPCACVSESRVRCPNCAGTYNPNSIPEPNNLFSNEFCGVANYSQSVGQVASWSDTNCNNQYIFMCETKPPSIVVAPLFNASTGAIFGFNPNMRTFDDASAHCKSLGGHLASYTTLAEQQEVEAYFTTGGFLIPKYHRYYWLGLKAVGPKNFNWVDPTMPKLSAPDSFKWWGMTKPDNTPEPNNFAGNELCAVGNFTEARKNAWGWADTGCTSQYVSICRMMGKRAAPVKPMNVAIASARITVPSTNATFYFNATPVDYNTAGERGCQAGRAVAPALPRGDTWPGL